MLAIGGAATYFLGQRHLTIAELRLKEVEVKEREFDIERKQAPVLAVTPTIQRTQLTRDVDEVLLEIVLENIGYIDFEVSKIELEVFEATPSSDLGVLLRRDDLFYPFPRREPVSPLAPVILRGDNGAEFAESAKARLRQMVEDSVKPSIKNYLKENLRGVIDESSHGMIDDAVEEGIDNSANEAIDETVGEAVAAAQQVRKRAERSTALTNTQGNTYSLTSNIVSWNSVDELGQSISTRLRLQPSQKASKQFNFVTVNGPAPKWLLFRISVDSEGRSDSTASPADRTTQTVEMLLTTGSDQSDVVYEAHSSSGKSPPLMLQPQAPLIPSR